MNQNAWKPKANLGNLQKDIQKLIKGLLTGKEKFHYLNKKSFAVKVEIKTSFSQFFS